MEKPKHIDLEETIQDVNIKDLEASQVVSKSEAEGKAEIKKDPTDGE